MVDYPKDWEEIELGKKGKLLGGLTGKNKQDFINGNAKLITYKNVFANIFIDLKINDKVKINDNEKQNILEYGDVCFTGSSETLEESGMSSVLIEEPLERLFLNSFCFIYRFFDLRIIYPKFAMHYFRATDIRNKIISTSRGITRYNISKEEFKKIKIFLPPLKEQQAIADILTSFDIHIDNLIKLIEKKKNIRDGALENLVSGKVRLSGFGKKWVDVPIKDISQKIITGGTPSTFVKEYWNGNIPWLSSTEIHQRKIIYPTKYITKLGLDNSSAKMVPKGSVIIALAGQGRTRGTVAYLNKDMALNQSLAAIVTNSRCNNMFLYYKVYNMYLELRELSSGDGGRGGLNKKLLSNIIINIPSDRKEQDAIANILTVMDDEIISLEKELDKIKQIREGAMNDLLTGQVRLAI